MEINKLINKQKNLKKSNKNLDIKTSIYDAEENKKNKLNHVKHYDNKYLDKIKVKFNNLKSCGNENNLNKNKLYKRRSQKNTNSIKIEISPAKIENDCRNIQLMDKGVLKTQITFGRKSINNSSKSTTIYMNDNTHNFQVNTNKSTMNDSNKKVKSKTIINQSIVKKKEASKNKIKYFNPKDVNPICLNSVIKNISPFEDNKLKRKTLHKSHSVTFLNYLEYDLHNINNNKNYLKCNSIKKNLSLSNTMYEKFKKKENEEKKIMLRTIFKKKPLKLKDYLAPLDIPNYKRCKSTLYPISNSFGTLLNEITEKINFVGGSFNVIYPKVSQIKYVLKEFINKKKDELQMQKNIKQIKHISKSLSSTMIDFCIRNKKDLFQTVPFKGTSTYNIEKMNCIYNLKQ